MNHNIQNINNNKYDNNFSIINNIEFGKKLNDILNDIKIMNLIPGEKLNIHFINEGLDHIL